MKDVIKWLLICAALVLILFISGVWLDGCVKSNKLAYAKYDERLSAIENQLKTKLDISKKDVEDQISNPDCPTLDEDFFSDIWINDYENRVVIYRRVVENGSVIFPNVMFCKTKDGLFLDGVLNAVYELQVDWSGHTNWGHVDNKFVTFFDKIPSFGEYGSQWNGKLAPRAVSLSSPSEFRYAGYNFWDSFYGRSFREKNLATIKVKDDNGNDIGLVERFVSDVFNKYFMDIDGLPILVDKDEKFEMFMNAMEFYTYLYKSLNNFSVTKKDVQNVIDVSNYLVHVIPKDERVNYPREIVDGVTKSTWSVYRQNKYIVCFYSLFLNDKITTPKDIEIVEKKYPLTPPPAQVDEYDIVRFKLVNKSNSDLMGYSYEANPVSININDKTYKFDTKDKFNNGLRVPLKINNTYSYSIDSSVLVFDSYSGSFELKSPTTAKWNFASGENYFDYLKRISQAYRGQTLELNYSYTSGYVVTSISLNPLSSYSSSDVNLSANPVKIVLNGKNNEGSYQYIFDKNEDLTSIKRLLVRCGEYDYAILSSQLEFANTSGTLTITPSERSFAFNFAVNKSSILGHLNVFLTSEEADSENSSYMSYSFLNSSGLCADLKVNNDDNIEVLIYLCDASGVIVHKNIYRSSSLLDLSGRFYIFVPDAGLSFSEGTYSIGVRLESMTKDGILNTGRVISTSLYEFEFSTNQHYTLTIDYTSINF